MINEETKRKLREMSMDPIIEALENQDNNRDVYSIMSFEERFAIAVDECYAAKNADKTRRLIHSANCVIRMLISIHYIMKVVQ